MAEKDDWILSQTGSFLGGDSVNFGSYQDWGGLNYGSEFANYYKSRTGIDINSGEAQTYSDTGYAASLEIQRAMGLPDQAQFKDLLATGSTLAGLQKSGYQAPYVDKSAQLSSLYGTKFSDADIEGALTGKYGELQGKPAMGQGWMDMYHTFNKWEQEDEMFRTEMMGLQNEMFPAAEAQQRAAMAAGGMETGSEQWRTALKGIGDKRMDVEAEVAERRAALEDTSVYKALMGQFEDMKGTSEMRGIEKTETRFTDVSSWVDPVEKYTGATYARDSETGLQTIIREGYWSTVPGHMEVTSSPYEHSYTEGTKTGRLLYGANEDKSGDPTFNDFYQSQFGAASNVANPYELGVSNQPVSDDDARARIAASGANMESV